MHPTRTDTESSENEACISSLNFTKTVEDINTSIDKQTSVVTTSMKGAELTNVGSNLNPSKKSKDGIVCDDMSLSNGGQSEEVSNPTVGQTFHEAENLSSKKKKLGKREKHVVLKRDMITSARKKGKLSADSEGLKTLPQDIITSARKEGKLSADSGGLKTLPQAAGDSTLETTTNIVEKEHVAKTSPLPVVVGLQCYAVTVSQSKKSKQMTSESPQNAVEPEAPQSGVLLEPNATGNEEREETFGDTVTKRKRGSPFNTQSNNGETSLAGNHKNGDRSGTELTLQPEKYDKPVKGKQGKRRMISLNITSSPQDLQDSSLQKENGNSEINVEKSLDTVSDDQPLSRWFLGKPSLAALESTGKEQPENSEPLLALTNGDGPMLTFEKRSSLWETIESMEAFRMIPQKPHFRPLDNIKESARERHAINKMVDFSSIFEEMRRLRIDHPRTEIEDQLETLLELETHGFDTDFIRNRLTELISLMDKREGLENRAKEVKDKLGNHSVDVQKLDKEIESIDKQVSDLLEKRDLISKEKEKAASEIVGLESEIDEIDEGMREYCSYFDELVTASFV
ncbi:hypothetical protein SSX86_010464 [Deinandra increscens subsp. villosa]|uniref:Uncharacterized protein n=1 Tax=Deinandra increscens subsp. villosa TaxID=3103831 RepID=A0AAP0H4Z0_9ASTR